jgi:hypothetical protein
LGERSLATEHADADVLELSRRLRRRDGIARGGQDGVDARVN